LILTHALGFPGLFSAALARERSGESKEFAPESQHLSLLISRIEVNC
jgi:hypothetical protein